LPAQWFGASSPARQRDEQRYERDPGEGRVSELGERQREQNARDQS